MRFYNPQPREYVDTFVDNSLPIEMMYKIGKDMDNSIIKTGEEISKKPIVEGGYQTQELAKAKQAAINAQMDEFAKQLGSGNPAELARKVAAFKNDLLSDKDYQTLLQDKAAKDYADKQLLTPGFNNYVQDYYDPNTGTYKQRKSGETFTADWYKSITPGDPQKEFKPYYDQIKERLNINYDPITESQEIDPYGNITIRRLQTGEEVRTISKDQVREAGRQLSASDPNFNALQSFNYAQAVHDKNFGKTGSVWNPETDNVDLFTDNFLGEFRNTKEIQKDLGTRVIKAPVEKTGGKGRSGKGMGIDGGYDNLIKRAYESVIAGNGEGSTQNIHTAAALADGQVIEVEEEVNGKKIKSEKILVNFDDKTVLIGKPSNLGGNEEDNLALIKNFNSYQSKMVELNEKAVKAQDKKNAEINIDNTGAKRTVKDPTNYYSNLTDAFKEEFKISDGVPIYVNDKGGVFLENVEYETGKTTFDLLPKEVKDQYIARWGEIPEVGEEVNLNNYGLGKTKKEYQAIENKLNKTAVNKGAQAVGAEQAAYRLEMLSKGIDLNSAETKAKIKKLESDTEWTNLQTKLEGQKLGERVADYKKSGKNLTGDIDQNLWLTMSTEITGAELDDMGIDAKDFPKYIRMKSGGTVFNWGNPDDAVYTLDVSTMAEGRINDKVRNANTGQYGSDANTEEGINAMVGEVDELIVKHKSTKIINNLKKTNETDLKVTINNLIPSIPNLEIQTAYKQALDAANAIPNITQRKEELAELYYALTSPDEYSIYKQQENIPEQSQSSSGGKPKKGWETK